MLDEHRPALVGVVEDDDVSRQAIARLLRLSGFDAALFDSAEAFIGSPPNRALLCLIVDVHLTGMSGIDLQQKLHSEGSEVPVVISTGDRADTVFERAHEAGCAGFLLKPFSAETLLSLLTSIARQSQH